PGAQLLKAKLASIAQHHRGGDTLSPLGIGDPDDRTLDDARMLAQHLFHLECRNLVAARFQDVDVAPSENPEDTILHDRGIARAKPAIAKGFTCSFRPAPVLPEDVRAGYFDLSGRAWRDLVATFIHEAYGDTRERPSDTARDTLAAIGIGKRH